MSPDDLDPYALIIVDMQYDFLPGGPLGVYGGDQIIRPIITWARHPQCKLVVASRDWHPENHFSFSDDPRFEDQSWPPHCIQKTRGARIFPQIAKVAEYVISKGMTPQGPDEYSAFAGKTLRPRESLEEILGRVPLNTIVVTGLALDYCVLYTALDANALGFNTIVPMECTREIGIGSGAPAIVKLMNAGVHVEI